MKRLVAWVVARWSRRACERGGHEYRTRDVTVFEGFLSEPAHLVHAGDVVTCARFGCTFREWRPGRGIIA